MSLAPVTGSLAPSYLPENAHWECEYLAYYLGTRVGYTNYSPVNPPPNRTSAVEGDPYFHTGVTYSHQKLHWYNEDGTPQLDGNGDPLYKAWGGQDYFEGPIYIGWPYWTLVVRNMNQEWIFNYDNFQIAASLVSTYYFTQNDWQGIPRLYSGSGVWQAWGIVEQDQGSVFEQNKLLWPDVMRLDNLTLPKIPNSRFFHGDVPWDPDATDWSGTTLSITRAQKPSENYPGRSVLGF